MNVLPMCTSVLCMCVTLRRSEQSTKFLGTGVIDHFQPVHGSWELNLGLLKSIMCFLLPSHPSAMFSSYLKTYSSSVFMHTPDHISAYLLGQFLFLPLCPQGLNSVYQGLLVASVFTCRAILMARIVYPRNGWPCHMTLLWTCKTGPSCCGGAFLLDLVCSVFLSLVLSFFHSC